jgi:hypothetical protein
MVRRCFNRKSDNYPDYGARGITVCERWRGPLGFQNFLADMGERPRGKTLDRKNANGNYERSNCRWATNHVQALNKRKKKATKPTASPQADVATFTVEEPF